MYTKSGLRFSGLAFCVELWTKQVSYRISVPMSYITCLDISLLHIMYYKKRQQRIQEGQFLKSALNHVLILQKDRSRCGDFAGIFIIEKGAFCVELRPFYCNKRISVPMSYISWLDISQGVYNMQFISLKNIWKNDSCESKKVKFGKVL